MFHYRLSVVNYNRGTYFGGGRRFFSFYKIQKPPLQLYDFPKDSLKFPKYVGRKMYFFLIHIYFVRSVVLFQQFG
jgi:hypothetical protein